MNQHQRPHLGADATIARSAQAVNYMSSVVGDELPADVDEPPDRRSLRQQIPPTFCRSPIKPILERKESLLTKALLSSPESEAYTSDFFAHRPTSGRSTISNESIASTAELTSDGGLTSPAHTNTPSPPLPCGAYTGIPPLTVAQKSDSPLTAIVMAQPLIDGFHNALGITVKNLPIEPAPRKRCITFACGARKDVGAKPPQVAPMPKADGPTRRPCTIKFACPARPCEKSLTSVSSGNQSMSTQAIHAPVPRSPSLTKKLRSLPTSSPRCRRGPPSAFERESLSYHGRPKFLAVDEEALKSSQATQFHEFAREEVQDDDWIREDAEAPKARLTINDTLKVENAIRKLGNEAEEEADDDENDDEADLENMSEDEAERMVEMESDVSENDASDGNETDNEAGFAASDDGSDSEGQYEFWTPSKYITGAHRPAAHRPAAHRRLSTSSIDSTGRPRDVRQSWDRHRSPHVKIRPGTPELPDGTDFVCGTLDEDRPLEVAYTSCMEARKQAKHHHIPQDIDPSFPTSDPEDDGEGKTVQVKVKARDSDDHICSGRLDDANESLSNHHRSPVDSRKRMFSPLPPTRRCRSPPPKLRLRSPPPRKLFSHSPQRSLSPAPALVDQSPAPSIYESIHGAKSAMGLAPLGCRPGLTHTKSLPRGGPLFPRNGRSDCATQDGDYNEHARGAIDIVKGLEHKRQHREKIYRSRRHNKAKPQPGQGAERMRELGLLMAGKTNVQTSYMLSL